MAHTTRVQMQSFNDYDYEVGMPEYTMQRSRTEVIDGHVDESEVVQGTVLWLPAKEDLPDRAVRRAHGKGAIEEGIFNHPVVVVSRPEEESHVVHFHLITSLQGRRLDQLYSKANEFHASRRSWYLPVAPTPDHPDANSKKTKKRFPTLLLANGGRLRWDSYVNIRHVYKIDLSLLRPYTNPETPTVDSYHFERESTIRMIAKGKSLTLYEPGPQVISPVLQRTRSEPTTATHETNYTATLGKEYWPTVTTQPPAGPFMMWADSRTRQGDFRMKSTDADRIAGTPPKVPPDGGITTVLSSVQASVVQPLEQLSGSVQSMASVTQQRLSVLYQNQVVLARAPLDRAWRDLKGVTAIAIASM